MRIIGGNLRGKNILNPTDKSTRPLKDMVRESIFNVLDILLITYIFLTFIVEIFFHCSINVLLIYKLYSILVHSAYNM